MLTNFTDDSTHSLLQDLDSTALRTPVLSILLALVGSVCFGVKGQKYVEIVGHNMNFSVAVGVQIMNQCFGLLVQPLEDLIFRHRRNSTLRLSQDTFGNRQYCAYC